MVSKTSGDLNRGNTDNTDMTTENKVLRLSGKNELLDDRWSSHQLISSRVLAKIVGKNHGHLMRDIREMEPSWTVFNRSKFGLVDYIDAKGEVRPCYMLKPEEVLFIATKFDDVSRARLVLRWKELEELRIAEYYAEMNKVDDACLKARKLSLQLAAARGTYNYECGMRDDTIKSLRKQLDDIKREMLRNEQDAIERENMLRAQLEGSAMEGANCTIKQMVRIIRAAGGWANEKYLFLFLWGNKLVDRSGSVTPKALYLGLLAKPDTRIVIDPDAPKKNFRITPKGQERLLALFGNAEYPYKGMDMARLRDEESQREWEQYISSRDAQYDYNL